MDHRSEEPGAPDETQPAASASERARILILEDDSWDADLAQRLLTDAGLDLETRVVDTREGFTEQLDGFRPDIILSDFNLPGFSGADALKIRQQRCPHVPFIIWSGMLGDEAAVELMKQGATDYILKDRPARLPAAVKGALTEAERVARMAQAEEQLLRAQRLASLGKLAAAEQAMNLTREMLADIRQRGRDTDSAR